ncbi:MAG TPA: hypothetical protein VLJ39_18355 [Tepidisphaeraceae bacterium]|nr:hypothetical protein [Tepidisphaeraceae bacterium]
MAKPAWRLERMYMAQCNPSLPTTDWSLVESAGSAVSARQSDAMQMLLLRYLPALKAHVLARWQVSFDQAEDWLQEFLSVKVLEQRLLGRASRERGRFRNFLRTTLDAFIVSQLRHDHAQKRMPGHLGCWEEVQHDVVAPEGEPDRAFEIAWGRQVIAEAVGRMESDCKKSGRQDLWGLFENRILLPILHGSPLPSYEEVVERFGFGSPLQAANALVTAKRMFQRSLRSVLSEYADDDAQVNEELAELQTILAGNRG